LLAFHLVEVITKLIFYPAYLFKTPLHGSSGGPTPKSTQELFYEIKIIKEKTESTELVFEDIPPEKGSLLVDSLSQDADVEGLRPR
jgi:hypothetical protein